MKYIFSALISCLAAIFFPHSSLAADSDLVVVELFTSQGCSSCPPADELVGELDAKHDNILALSYHVDYWNYIGWKDPFSSAAMSDYQRRYAAAMNSSRVYTPQMIINGRHDVVGSRRNSVLSTVVKAKGEVRPLTLNISKESNGIQKINIAGSVELSGANIMLVTYIPVATTDVTRGENRNRSLTDHNVVMSFSRLGTMENESQMIGADIPQGQQGALLIQNAQNMHIIAAAKL